MAISDEDFNRIMGAAHPEEDSSPSSISDEEFKNILSSAGANQPQQMQQQESSSLKAFAKNVVQGFGTGPVFNTVDYLESVFPNVMGMLDEGGLDSIYGPGFSSPETTDQERREMIQAHHQRVKAEFISKYYLDVDDTNNKIASFLGNVTGALADPSTLLAPANVGETIMARVGNMAKFGAAFGAVQGATEDLAARGDISPENVIVSAALGAAGGAAIQGVLVEPLTRLLGRASSRGRPITADEVENAVKGHTEAPVDAAQIADNLNAEAGLSSKTTFQTSKGSTYEVGENGVTIRNKAARPEHPGQEGVQPASESTFYVDYEGLHKLGEIQTQGAGIKRIEIRGNKAAMQYLEGKDAGKFESRTVTDIKTEPEVGLYPVELWNDGKTVHFGNEIVNVTKGGEITPELARIQQEVDNILSPDDGVDPRDIERLYKEGKADEFLKGADIDTQMAIAANQKRRVPESPETFGKVFEDTDDAISREMATYNEFWDLMKDSPELKKTIIDSSPKTRVETNAVGGEDNAALNAIKSEDISATSELGQRIDPPSSTPIDFDNPKPEDFQLIANKVAKTWGILDPGRVLKKAGKAGEIAARLLDDYKDKGRQELGSRMSSVREIFSRNNITPDQMTLLSAVREGAVDLSKVPKNVIKASDEINTLMRGEVIEAHKRGFIEKEQAKKLLKNKNYWPHVFDIAYLQTDKGSEAFGKALNSVKHTSKEAAERALLAISNRKRIAQLSSYVKEIKQADGTKTVWIDPNVSKLLWSRIEGITDSAKSRHLEMERKFPAEYNDALRPFLIQNPEAVLEKYFEDTINRNLAAKIFGKNHEIAKDLFKELLNTTDPKTALMFREAFWTTMRDPRSQAIQSFINAPEKVADMARILRALQVFKLSMSQITNLGQIPSIGWAWLAGRGGVTPAQKFQLAMTSMAKGFRAKTGNKELAEEAMRAGASVQTALMEIVGKLNEPTNSIIGRRVKGIGEVFNNPSEFLKWTGFNWTEEFNRITAYHMGKGYIETLISNRIKYEDLLKRNPANGLAQKKLEGILKGLEEMGIPRNINPNDITIRQIKDGTYKIQGYADDLGKAIMLGGQRTSNAINFVNDTHRLPLFASSFWGKLIFQLKTFAYNSFHFFREHVLAPAKKGNFGPAIMYLAAGQLIAGPAIVESKRFLLGDDTELSALDRAFRYQTSVAGLGLLQDALSSTTFGVKGALSFLAGPAISSVAGIASGFGSTYNVARKNYEDTGSILGTNLLEPVPKAVLKEVSVPWRRAILSKMTADKDAFEAKYQRLNNSDKELEKRLERIQKKLDKD